MEYTKQTTALQCLLENGSGHFQPASIRYGIESNVITISREQTKRQLRWSADKVDNVADDWC
jgi:hypothetical protein